MTFRRPDPAAEVARVVELVEVEPAADDAAPGTGGWLQRLCCVATRDLPAWGAAVSLVAEQGSLGLAAASDVTSANLDGLQFLLGEGPCMDVLDLRRPVLVPELAGESGRRWPGYSAAAYDHGARSVFAFPLQVGAACAGVLDLYRDRVGSLSTDELTRALTFAQVATTALLDGQLRADRGHTPDGIDDVLDSRYALHQAQGMVMVQLDISLADAMARLRAYAYADERGLDQVAADIVARRLTLEQDQS